MKYYIIAGEASGDLHGEMLIEGIKTVDPNAEFRFWGGEKMLKTGGQLARHYKETAFMGFFEIVKHFRKIKDNFNFCHEDILEYNPDAIILIDYPGFNLRIAKFSKEHGFKVIYYIAPKIWAWKTNRVKKIKKYVDRLYAIFPFEVTFYKKYGYEVDYVGNPLLQKISEFKKNTITSSEFRKAHNLNKKKIIALLPGSRKSELEKCIPELKEVYKVFKEDYQFVIAGISSIEEDFYNKILSNEHEIKIIYDQTYEILNNSYAAVVVSGTAVLETALFNVPQVAFYKVSSLTFLMKPLLKIKFFTLPNIIMNKEIVKEYLQKNLAFDLTSELNNILNDDNYRKQMQNNYNELSNMLGPEGAPKRAAMFIYDYLNLSLNEQ